MNEPALLFGKVMHGRLFPKTNHFTYGIYYLSIPLSKIENLPISYNSLAPLSFYDRDHGHCDGSDLQKWAKSLLSEYNIKEADGEIILICMPRVIGYVFNPVSFWLCKDVTGNIRAVLCEVHNTFGEKHTYLCAKENHAPISHEDILKGKKIFHVSPFLKREGYYEYRFDTRNNEFKVMIDYYNENGKKQLVTALYGTLEPMTKDTLHKAFWTYPLITFKAIILIHWQALKLLYKGIKFISKPKQFQVRTSATENLTKM